MLVENREVDRPLRRSYQPPRSGRGSRRGPLHSPSDAGAIRRHDCSIRSRSRPEQTGAGWSRPEQAGADPSRPEQAGAGGAGGAGRAAPGPAVLSRPCAGATTWDTPCSIPGATRRNACAPGPRRDLDGPRPARCMGAAARTRSVWTRSRGSALSSAKSRAGRLGHTRIDTRPPVARRSRRGGAHPARLARWRVTAIVRDRPSRRSRQAQVARSHAGGSGKDPKLAPESVEILIKPPCLRGSRERTARRG
jgi:hypothetical protein